MNENNVERIAKILAEDHGDPQAWGAYASKAMQIIEIALSDNEEEEDQDEVFRANGFPVAPMTLQEIEKAQAEFDDAVAEMFRRHKKRGFPYRIPR